MANIHSVPLTFTHSLVTAFGFQVASGIASGTCPQSVTQCAQRSFASGRVNSLHRSYDLMCQSQSLSPAIACRSLGSPCSLDHPLLVFGTFPTLSAANLSLDAWTLTPALSVVPIPVSSH